MTKHDEQGHRDSRVDDRRRTGAGDADLPAVYPDLTPEQLDGMDMWDRDPAVFQERSRPIWAMLVRSAVAEIRRGRAREERLRIRVEHLEHVGLCRSCGDRAQDLRDILEHQP